MKSILITILLLAFAGAGSAQNTVKLFDPTLIAWSDSIVLTNSFPYGMFKTAQVYLSCPASGRMSSTISGPNGGDFIVDNFLMINDSYICSGNCFNATTNPLAYLGMPVEMGYEGVRPISVSRVITESGLYTFNLIDYGEIYGNGAIYLTTSCSITPVNIPPQGPGPGPSPSPTPTTSPTPNPTPTPDPTSSPEPGGSTLCHVNSGTNGWQTLTVGSAAVSSHLAHGDYLGACSQ